MKKIKVKNIVFDFECNDINGLDIFEVKHDIFNALKSYLSEENNINPNNIHEDYEYGVSEDDIDYEALSELDITVSTGSKNSNPPVGSEITISTFICASGRDNIKSIDVDMLLNNIDSLIEKIKAIGYTKLKFKNIGVEFDGIHNDFIFSLIDRNKKLKHNLI